MGLWDPFEQGVLDSVPVYDFKKLEIVRTLGQGFYGVVRLVRYQGKHSGTKVQAAFKHLKDEHRGDIDKEKMLQEEAMAMLSLDSNHTVKCLGLVHDYGRTDAPVFCGFLMEQMDGCLTDMLKRGESLTNQMIRAGFFSALLKKIGPFGGSVRQKVGQTDMVLAAVLHVLCEVLPGVAILHALGLVHRDMHPGNILMKGICFKISDLGRSTWGRGASMEWKGGHTAKPGRGDTVPLKAQSESTPHSLEAYDMLTLSIVVSRVALWASGAPEEVWNKYGDSTWPSSRRSSSVVLEEFKVQILEAARALCGDEGREVAELLANLGHVDRSKCPTPLEALKAAYALRHKHFKILPPGADTAEGQVLSALEALSQADGKMRWAHHKALGMRCTPRNIFYLAKTTDPLIQASAIDLDLAGEKEIGQLCEQGDVETARTVIKRMRRRGVRVTAATYLPLFVALRKARRIPRIDRMEELQDEMEGQGIKPSAEVLYELLQMYRDLGQVQNAEHTLVSLLREAPSYDLKLFAATALLVCYRNIGEMEGAENVLYRMMRRGIRPSVVTYTELVLGYAWKGEMDKAEEVVARMKKALARARAQSCEGTYTALMEGYANAGDMGSMMGALVRMEHDNIRPGDRTYNVLINACGDSVEDAQQWFARMKEEGCAPTAWTYRARALVLGRAGRTGADMEALMEEVQREKDLRRL